MTSEIISYSSNFISSNIIGIFFHLNWKRTKKRFVRCSYTSMYLIQVNWARFRKEINMFSNIVVRGKFQCMVDPRNISLPPRLFRSYYSEYRSSKFWSWIRLVDYWFNRNFFFVSCKQRKKFTRILNFFLGWYNNVLALLLYSKNVNYETVG